MGGFFCHPPPSSQFRPICLSPGPGLSHPCNMSSVHTVTGGVTAQSHSHQAPFSDPSKASRTLARRPGLLLWLLGLALLAGASSALQPTACPMPHPGLASIWSCRRSALPSSPGCPSTSVRPLEPPVFPRLTHLFSLFRCCCSLSPPPESPPSGRRGPPVAAAPCSPRPAQSRRPRPV